MVMVDNYLHVLRNYANFDGRAGRAEYWWFMLAHLICSIALVILQIVVEPLMTLFSIVYLIYSLGVLIPFLAVIVRRLHDIDKSAWGLIFVFIPLVGILFFIIFGSTPTHPQPNKYGLPASPVPE